MNIMFLIFSFNVGGIERLLIDMSEELIKRGNHVSICIINEDYDNDLLNEIDHNVDVIKLDRRIGAKWTLGYMSKLAYEIRKREVDILHCQGINCVLFSYLAKILNPGIAILNTVHDVGNYPSYSGFKLFMQNLILDKTIAISKTVEREILSRKQKKSKVVTVFNAVDLTKFTLAHKRESCPNIVLGNVARFYPAKKGQDVLVDAMDILQRQGIDNVICKFAGDIFKGQDSEYKKIKELVKQYDLCNKIEFCGGIDNVPAFLDDIDVFVLPSRFEGFGIALIESLAMGIPVVASNIDGPKEIFELAKADGVDIGFLARTGDAQDFAANINNCIGCMTKYDKEKIRKFVQEHFSIKQMIDEHLEIYNSLLKGNNNINDN